MKMICQLQPHGWLNLWINKLPQATFIPQYIMREKITSKQIYSLEYECISIEIYIPRGARVSYGLLGAKYTPRNIDSTSGDGLDIEVLVSTKCEKQINWALASAVDKVFLGLPEEYSAVILEKAVDKAAFSVGTLSFCCAAHGITSSSKRIFRDLTDAIISLMKSVGRTKSTEDMNSNNLEILKYELARTELVRGYTDVITISKIA